MDYEKLEFNESTFKQIIAKNKSLTDELHQCTQDKEFVWNLWKEMQVAHPNTANIVNSVIEREQEKSDKKAAKVLTVLQEKDKQINILQEISADLQIQLKHTNERVSELLVKESEWSKKENELLVEINNLKNEIHSLSDQNVNKEQIEANIERKYVEELLTTKSQIEELSGMNTSLVKQLKNLNEELTLSNTENEKLKTELFSKDENVLSTNEQLKTICKEKENLIGENEVLKNDLKKIKGNLKKKTKEVEEIQTSWENKVNKNIEVNNEQHEKIEQLQQEILSLNKELNEHSNSKETQDEDRRRIKEQARLIEQLEKLQDESQNVFSQQQKTFESELTICKKTIKNLKKQIKDLQTNTNDKENIGVEQNNAVQDDKNSAYPNTREKASSPDILEKKIVLSQKDIDENIDDLKKKHKNRKIIISSPKDELKNPSKCCQQKCCQITSHSAVVDETEEITQYKSKCDMFAKLVQSMETELETTRIAHKKRLKRYKFLEESCHLLQKQLATYEAETEKAKKKIPRASLKSLQREDSTSVWNELEYYRREYNKFKFEMPKLNEKIDCLEVEQSHYDTLIDKFQIEADKFKELLHTKDLKNERLESMQQMNESRLKSQQQEIRSCYEKIETAKKELSNQHECFASKETSLQETIQNLRNKLEELRTKEVSIVQVNVETQTDVAIVDKVEKVIHDAISNVIPDKTHIHTDSFFSVGSQTYPDSKQYVNVGSQTEESQDHEEQKEQKEHQDDLNNQSMKTKEDNVRLKLNFDDLKMDYDELKVSYDESQSRINKLKKENKKLSAEQISLSSLNEDMLKNEKANKESILNQENTIAKLKDELLVNLKTLQETSCLLEKKSKEAEQVSQELNIALSNEQKGKNIQKKKTKEIKSYERQLEEWTTKCSQLSFQVKTLMGENEILTDKQKTFQTRVGKLEKDLIQKRTLYDELKIKFEDAKNEISQKQSSLENLKLKMNAAIEREKNKKIFTEELKIKIDTLTKEKSTLQDSISILREENNKKTELLHKTQHLCHQAEVAIQEVEQIEQKPDNNKHLEKSNEKYLKQLGEFKSVINRFTDALITKISKNRNMLVEMREQKKRKEMEMRQNSLLGNHSSIACSILGMSTQDLVNFMTDDSSHDANDVSLIYDDDIRKKLAVILRKESNFEKVLTQFLVDLIKYNESLCEKQKEV